MLKRAEGGGEEDPGEEDRIYFYCLALPLCNRAFTILFTLSWKPIKECVGLTPSPTPFPLSFGGFLCPLRVITSQLPIIANVSLLWSNRFQCNPSVCVFLVFDIIVQSIAGLFLFYPFSLGSSYDGAQESLLTYPCRYFYLPLPTNNKE